MRALYEQYRTVVAGARNKLSGKVVRLGTMGAFGVGTILTDVSQLETVLAKLCHPVVPGAAVSAVQKHLVAN